MLPLAFHRVGALPLSDLDELLDSLRNEDVDVLPIDGSMIIDTPTLMAHVATDLGIADHARPSTWDGLSDRVYAVLAELTAPRAVVVWTDADQLVRHSLNDLLMAVIVFSDLARTVATTATGFPRPLRLDIVLLGADPAFNRTD